MEGIYYTHTHTHIGDTHILPHILACGKLTTAQCIPWCRCSFWKPVPPKTLTQHPSPSLLVFIEIWLFCEATTSPAAFLNECVHSPKSHMPWPLSGCRLHILLVPQLSFALCQQASHVNSTSGTRHVFCLWSCLHWGRMGNLPSIILIL